MRLKESVLLVVIGAKARVPMDKEFDLHASLCKHLES